MGRWGGSRPEEKAMSEAVEIPERFLSGEQADAVMEILRDLDSVEVKLSVPMDEQYATLRGLGLDPVEAEPRQIYFFDTADLALNRAGVVVRARRIPGGFGDTVVKLRPVAPTGLPDGVRRSGSFKLEVDVAPGGYVVSGSMKGKATGQEIRDVAAGTRRLTKILTKEQRAFFRAHAPAGIGLDDLQVLGPTFSLKASVTPKALDRKVVVELWLYPDGSRLLELSAKCMPMEASVFGVEFRRYLGERGITVSGAQAAKTRNTLAFYTAQLKAAAAARAAPAPTEIAAAAAAG
jgi:hypothetical protein